MALDRGDEDILARALTKALRDAGWRGGGAGPAGGSSGGGGDDTAGRRRARKLGDLQQKLIETSRELLALDQNEIENTIKGQRLKKKHDLILQEASRSLKQATDEIKPGAFSQMYADAKAFSRNTEGLTSKLAQATKNASMFSAGLLQSHELIDSSSHSYRDFMSTLGSAAGKLNNSFLRQNKLIDDITGELRDNINPADIAQLRVKTGRIQAMMIEQLSSLGLTDVSQLNPEELARRTATGQQTGAGSAQEMHRAILTVARQLQAEGLISGAGNLSDPTNVNYAELAQAVQDAGASLAGFTTTVDTEGRRASTVWNRYVTGGLTTLNSAINNFARNLTNSGTIVSNMGRAVDASKAVYQDMMKFNVAGLTTGFAEAQVMSVKMGMSFEDTVAYLQENRRLLGLYGSTEFEKLNSDFKETFQKFGYTMQQGAAAVGPTIEAAITAGIDIRSGEQLNKFMEQTAAGFAEVRGYIAESLPEYAKLNAALYNEAEVKDTLLGLDKQRSALYAQSLVQQRNDLIVRGLSTQQAQEMVKLQEQAKREKVSSRIQTGAMLAIQAQQMGMSPEDAQRAMQVQMQGRAASKEDTAWLTGTFIPEFAKKQAQYGAELAGTGAGASQIGRDILLEKTEIGGPLGQMIKGMQDLGIKEKAGVGATPQEQERIKQQSAGSVALAEMGNAVNSVTSILNNNFASALLASSQALLGLAGQAGLGGFASLVGGAGGLLQTTVGLSGGMAAFAGQLGLAAAAGLATYTATSALLEKMGYTGEWGGDVYEWLHGDSDKKEREAAEAKAAQASKQKAADKAQTDIAQGTQISPYAAKLLADRGVSVPPDMIRSQGAPAAPATAPPITPAEAAATAIAVPAAFASPGVVPGTAPGAPGVNTTVQTVPVGGTSATSVSDLTAQQKLEVIASNMIEAVSILKQISTNTDASTKEIRSTRPLASAIPNQSSYLTGRVQ